MLSFLVINEGKGIQIDCDQEGVSVLLKTLGALIGERAGHRHLLSASNGGHELSEVGVSGKPAVGEVIIDYVEADPS